MRNLIVFGKGLIGNAILQSFTGEEYSIVSVSTNEVNLLDYIAIDNFVSNLDIDDVLIFAAGLSGGISFNLNNPLDLYSKNIRMINNFISAAADRIIKNVLNIVPACVYPANLNQRAKVEDLWQ